MSHQSEEITVHYARPGNGKPLCGVRGNVGENTSSLPKYVNCGLCIKKVMSGFSDLDNDYRKRLILAMRREGIMDSITAKVLGLTRERVRQIGGNITEDENLEATKMKMSKEKIESFLKDVRAGERPAVLALRYGLKNSGVVLDTIRRLGAWEDYRLAKNKRRYDRIRERLAEFAKHLRGKGIEEYQTCDLVAYDNGLYTLAVRTGFLVEWSRELGMRYLTGEKRRESERDWVVDSKHERRRGI